MRSIKNLAYAVFASAKWHMPENYQVLPRHLGSAKPTINYGAGPLFDKRRKPFRERPKANAMTMTDPIADMLARLRNANSAYHEKVAMPSSSVKARIAEILKQEGYISGYHIESNPTGFGKTLVLDLKFGSNRERSIAGLRRVSKPGLRVYAKSTSLPKVLGGLGVAIISTSSGLLTDKQANKQGVGGEVLAYVW
jgi:small subunit ribosomal protein S8